MTTLSFITPEADPNMNVLLYGPPGSGKTVGAASAPGPILYLNAERPNAVRFAHKLHGDRMKIAPMEGLQTLIDVTLELETGKYQSFVLDTVGEAYGSLLREASNDRMNPHLDEYRDAGTHMERFVRKVFDLPVNAIIVAHEMTVDETEGGAERVPFCTTQSGSPVFGAKLMAAADVVGYCGVVNEEDRTRYMAQLTNARGRRGKDRFAILGSAHDLDLSEWVALAKESEKPKKKEPTKRGKAAEEDAAA